MSQQRNYKINKNFGERLRELRGRLSQAAFAAKLGLGSQQQYANYEKGRVPTHLLQQISQQLGVSIGFLLGTEETSSQISETPSASGSQVHQKILMDLIQAMDETTLLKKISEIQSDEKYSAQERLEWSKFLLNEAKRRFEKKL